MGILKKKQQQAKQKKLSTKKQRSNEGIRRTYTNPKGNSYERFMRAGKWICDTTSGREDPDGYRIRRQPSGGEIERVYLGEQSRAYRRYIRNQRRVYNK
jgi:hypothetical protein